MQILHLLSEQFAFWRGLIWLLDEWEDEMGVRYCTVAPVADVSLTPRSWTHNSVSGLEYFAFSMLRRAAAGRRLHNQTHATWGGCVIPC